MRTDEKAGPLHSASQHSTIETRFQNRLRAVYEYLQFRNLPAGVKRRVRGHFSTSYRAAPRLYDEEWVLQRLSEPLRREVLSSLGRDAVERLPVFRGFADECIGLIVANLQPANFVPGQRIYTRGDCGTDLYIIVNGRVSLIRDDIGRSWTFRSSLLADRHRSSVSRQSTPSTAAAAAAAAAAAVGTSRRGSMSECHPQQATLTGGDIFGELALFPKKCSGARRRETAVAESWTSVLALSERALHEVIGPSYPQVILRLQELCEWRALEYRFMDPVGSGAPETAGAQSDREESGEENWEGASRLEMRTALLKQELLRLAEEEVLRPTAGEDGGEVVRLFRLTTSSVESGNNFRWIGMSCVVSDRGKLLCINHTRQDLDRRFPRFLGALVRGRSTARPLSPSELQVGNTGMKQSQGYEVLLFAAPVNEAVNSTDTKDLLQGIPEVPEWPGEGLPPNSGWYVSFCAASSDDFAELRDSLQLWCKMMVTRPFSTVIMSGSSDYSSISVLEPKALVRAEADTSMARVDSLRWQIADLTAESMWLSSVFLNPGSMLRNFDGQNHIHRGGKLREEPVGLMDSESSNNCSSVMKDVSARNIDCNDPVPISMLDSAHAQIYFTAQKIRALSGQIKESRRNLS